MCRDDVESLTSRRAGSLNCSSPEVLAEGQEVVASTIAVIINRSRDGAGSNWRASGGARRALIARAAPTTRLPDQRAGKLSANWRSPHERGVPARGVVAARHATSGVGLLREASGDCNHGSAMPGDELLIPRDRGALEARYPGATVVSTPASSIIAFFNIAGIGRDARVTNVRGKAGTPWFLRYVEMPRGVQFSRVQAMSPTAPDVSTR